MRGRPQKGDKREARRWHVIRNKRYEEILRGMNRHRFAEKEKAAETATTLMSWSIERKVG